LHIDIRNLYGRSALLLSGGATFGLYHLGVVKAQLLPRVIAGSSAGSLVACLLATRHDADLMAMFEPNAIQFEAMFSDSDTIYTKMLRFVTKGAMLDSSNLQACLRREVGDITFREAYERTGRILNIVRRLTAFENIF
jgi:predicted acylesterase/phospholipase RssA